MKRKPTYANLTPLGALAPLSPLSPPPPPARGRPPAKHPRKPIQVKLTEAELESYRRASMAVGLSVSAWMRLMLARHTK